MKWLKGGRAAAAAALLRTSSRSFGGLGSATRTARPSRSGTARSTRLRRNVASRLALYRKRKNPMIRRRPYSNSGGVGTYSKFGLFRRPSSKVRMMKKVGAPNVYVTNLGEQLQCSEGFQSVQDWPFLNEQQIVTMNTQIGGSNSKKFVVESLIGEFIMTNSSLATAYVDIYDIVRKRDSNPTNPGSATPLTAWRQGLQRQTPGGSALALEQDINTLPTDSSLFNDYFKVKRRTHVALAQGATHKHSVKLGCNALIDEQMLTNAQGVAYSAEYAGLTVHTMIVVHGQPASIPREGGGLAIVTTAAVAIDLVYAQRIKYTWVQDASVTFHATDNLSTLTGEQVVSAGAGAIVANAFV